MHSKVCPRFPVSDVHALHNPGAANIIDFTLMIRLYFVAQLALKMGKLSKWA